MLELIGVLEQHRHRGTDGRGSGVLPSGVETPCVGNQLLLGQDPVVCFANQHAQQIFAQVLPTSSDDPGEVIL